MAKARSAPPSAYARRSKQYIASADSAIIAICTLPAWNVAMIAGPAMTNGVSQTVCVPRRSSRRRATSTATRTTNPRLSANQSRRKLQKSGVTRPSRRGTMRNGGGYS